jgi:hypothetical protein
MNYPNNNFVDPYSEFQTQQGNKRIKNFYIGFIILLSIIGVYFLAARYLALWPFQIEKKPSTLIKTKNSEKIPSLIYSKGENNVYHFNLYSNGSISKLPIRFIADINDISISPDYSKAIIATKESLFQIASEGKVQGSILNLEERRFKYNEDPSVYSPVFSADGKRVIYFAHLDSNKSGLRIFDINSGEDKSLFEFDRKTLDNLNRKYGFNSNAAEYFIPVFWFRDSYGEKVVLVHKKASSPAGVSIDNLFGLWIYDFKKSSISPIKVYDNQGNLLPINCFNVYKNDYKTLQTKCELFSLISKSHDRRYLVISQEPMFPDELSASSDNPIDSMIKKAEKEKLFVLDLSMLANNTGNNLKHAIIPLPKCSLSELRFYPWSPDNRKIVCNETKIEETDVGPFFFTMLYSAFNNKEIKKNYKVTYTNYLIDIDSKTKTVISQNSKTVTLPEEFIQSIKNAVQSKYGGTPENLYMFFVLFLDKQNEMVLEMLPGNQFIISKPASPDGSRRQLVVSDLKGKESVIDEAIGQFPYFQFFGWIK